MTGQQSRLVGGVLTVVGLSLVAVSLSHVIVESEPLPNVFVGVAPVTALSVAVVYAGVRILRRGVDPSYVSRLTGWALIGTVGGALLSSFFVIYQSFHDVAIYDPLYVITNTTTAGLVSGLVAGGYDVRAQRKADRLDETNEVLNTIRYVNQEAVKAETRTGLEEAVCAEFADSESYSFAWTSRYDSGAERLVPSSAAGIDRDGLEAVSLTDDETPSAIAARTRETEVRSGFDRTTQLPVPGGALDEVRSCISIPLAFEDSLYGVLTLCSERPGAFAVREQAILTELGNTVAHGISAIETRESLEQSERRFRCLFERHSAPMLLVNSESGRIERANDAAVEFYGYDREELTSMDVEDINTLSAEEIRTEMEQARSENWNHFVFEHRLASGEVRTVEVHSTPVPMGDRPTLFSIVHDITERREYQHELETEREFVQTALNTITDHFFVLDREEGLVRWNDQVLEATGYTPEELQSLSPVEYFREDDHERVRDAIETAFETGDVTVEATLVASDGEEIPMEYRAKRLSTDGEASKLVGIGRDISDRLEYESELRRYKELFDNVPIGIFRNTPGPEGEFLEVNPAMVNLFDADSKAELLAHSVADLYADPSEREEFSERLTEDGIVYEAELELQTLSGEPFWATVVAIEHEYPNGDRYFDGAVEDVTERREYEDALERHTKELELLNQLLRHDIRNDMTVVCGMAEVLEDAVTDDGEDDLQTLKAKADHVVELTHTARDLTESMSFDAPSSPSLSTVSLTDVLRDEIAEARSSYPDADITVEGDVPDVRVRANGMLESVFRNLLNNAVQHNDKEIPEVRVRLRLRDDTVAVEVEDNGPGIPETLKERVFEHGEKGERSTGTGLGLHLVRTLVKQYGGGVDVEDADPEGTVFTVRLQRADV